ncbi:kinesin motor domain-containing protein [Cardiosporidium cionae]|uniref:Kinesin-like protein n=1 Tax=Cardiosporidium cionae TaxID=476202 RepID=A0ABQ7JEM3_9APIC|nr:kinesin motor domain-containing protein [Cardiosporidium cionae]|eukprot:KAF8822448.1 kinesin motor domain-containing protein [Cardiosporidium cionae]
MARNHTASFTVSDTPAYNSGNALQYEDSGEGKWHQPDSPDNDINEKLLNESTSSLTIKRSECYQAEQEASSVVVAVRVRPLFSREIHTGCKNIVSIIDNEAVILLDPMLSHHDDVLRINRSREKNFVFDCAFSANCNQQTVFAKTTKLLLEGVIQGLNATIFTYGATGTGKTYTMFGDSEQPGIMMLTLQDLFDRLSAQQAEKSFQISASFLEIYNENIRDLLQPKSDYLEIREEPERGMSVAGAVEIPLKSTSDFMHLLSNGNQQRTQEPTEANLTSSRSHAVLQVTVQGRLQCSGVDEQIHIGKLSMIDLAGSERAAQTKNRGLRMIEGANINRSLLALGNVINALAERSKNRKGVFVPFRDSKLTRLLKDSLGGNCKTMMIANISPSHVAYEDTHNTLKYAYRTKSIKSKVVRNVVNINYHIARYTQVIEELRAEIMGLKSKLAMAQNEVPQKISCFYL